MARNGTHFSDSHFEKKLNNLKDTQESIQGLSTWCLNHKSDLNHIIKCWLKAIKKSKPEQCLTLFYLANDVIQHSKKKNLLDLVSAWEFALKEATPYARYFWNLIIDVLLWNNYFIMRSLCYSCNFVIHSVYIQRGESTNSCVTYFQNMGRKRCLQ